MGDVASLQAELASLQLAVAEKQAALAAASTAPVFAFSASFGRTTVARVHAASGKGLSLVRQCAALRPLSSLARV